MATNSDPGAKEWADRGLLKRPKAIHRLEAQVASTISPLFRSLARLPAPVVPYRSIALSRNLQVGTPFATDAKVALEVVVPNPVSSRVSGRSSPDPNLVCIKSRSALSSSAAQQLSSYHFRHTRSCPRCNRQHHGDFVWLPHGKYLFLRPTVCHVYLFPRLMFMPHMQPAPLVMPAPCSHIPYKAN